MTRDKRILIGILAFLIFLLYLVLYFSTMLLPLKLSIGFSFPLILSSGIILMRIDFLSNYKKGGIFVIFLVIVGLVFFPVLPYSYTQIVGDEEIHETVNDFNSDSKTSEGKLNKIMRWENDHLSDLYNELPITWNIPIIWYRSENPSWIFYYKIANCEEQAILFTEMAETLESVEKARVVHNPAEDHKWAEVLIKNSWRQVDPTRVEFLEPSNYEEERDVQVSFVFVYENGRIKNVTEQYSDIGNLIVEVTKNGSPLKNTKIFVKSKYLMNNSDSDDYKKPRNIILYESKTFLTDENGKFQFTLGGNEYEIVAKKNGKRVTKSVTIRENRTTRVKLKMV